MRLVERFTHVSNDQIRYENALSGSRAEER